MAEGWELEKPENHHKKSPGKGAFFMVVRQCSCRKGNCFYSTSSGVVVGAGKP